MFFIVCIFSILGEQQNAKIRCKKEPTATDRRRRRTCIVWPNEKRVAQCATDESSTGAFVCYMSAELHSVTGWCFSEFEKLQKIPIFRIFWRYSLESRRRNCKKLLFFVQCIRWLLNGMEKNSNFSFLTSLYFHTANSTDSTAYLHKMERERNEGEEEEKKS